jgi:orotidine-5'-phosphate decarboxylase
VTDLSEFDGAAAAQEAGIDVKIVHPVTGADLGIVVTIVGPDSKRAIAARMRTVNEALKANRLNKATAESLDDRSRRQLAELCVGWSGVVVQGETLDFSVDTAISVFRRFPWLQEQVDAAAGDRTAFFQRSSQSSATV